MAAATQVAEPAAPAALPAPWPRRLRRLWIAVLLAAGASVALLQYLHRGFVTSLDRAEDLQVAITETAVALGRAGPDPRAAAALEGLRNAHAAEQARLRRLAERYSIVLAAAVLLVLASAAAGYLITRRHLAVLGWHQRLRAQTAAAERESREKSSFLANISHEIRTPMNALFGFSRLLYDRLEDPVNRRHIEAITTSASALLALIDDTLDLSRIEAGKLEFRPAPTDLGEVAQGVVLLFSQQARDKGITLRLESHGLPEAVMVDERRVRQMLFNLVANAIKYTERGEVVLRVAAAPEKPGRVRCVLEVADTGIGIAAEDVQRIFEPFRRGPAAVTDARQGTGLGLSITRHLAQLMGGHVEVESQPERGSRFRIVLPGVATAAAPPAAPRPATRLAALPPRTVLVVDDVALNRQLLADLCRGTPLRVLCAADAPEGLALARSARPDAVLMDLRMPGVDGIEALRRLRADPALRRIPVIAMTAMAEKGSRRRAAFDGWLVKPFTEAALYDELSRVFARGAEPAAGTGTLTPEARGELRRIEREEWPALRKTPVMRDVRRFVGRLEAVAAQASSGALAEYARGLAGAAEAFDVGRVEALLEAFPEQVRRLRAVAGENRDGA